MTIKKTPIEGLLIIPYKRFNDLRGSLLKPFSLSYIDPDNKEKNLIFKEAWFTVSKKNVIRGMHLQAGDHPCEKLVSVIQGRVTDVVLDLRKESVTYGEYFETELSSTDPFALYIPKGCAHGYKVEEDNTITLYMATDIHHEKDDVGIRWDSFNYDWKIEAPILSDRDKELPPFPG